MADDAPPGATGREHETEAEQAWPVQVTTLQMHEVRTGLLILSLATERLRRRRGDDAVVADTVVLIRRALARIMATIEVGLSFPSAVSIPAVLSV